MELVGIVKDPHQRLADARQHGIEAVRASGKSGSARSGIGVFELIKAYYTIIPQIQANDTHYRKYDYGERLAFTSGVLEELELNL
ncbi:TPA: hypothetical protein H1005_03650 [archaeon]|nr:hypothetical protein [Candidatus Naiadarchaeales archaeon SRR2090153.bin1042]